MIITNPYLVLPPSSLPPSLPNFFNIGLAAGLDNYNPVGYPAGNNGVFSDSTDVYPFTSPPPFSLDYALGTAPIDVFFDQNAATNNLTAAGAARPTLQVTSPVIVTGIGVGTYTYRGQLNGYTYYNLTGHATSTTLYTLYADGDGFWYVTDGAGSIISNDGQSGAFAFPWLADWSVSGSTVTQGHPQGMVVFDGVANGMQAANNVTLDKTLTLNMPLTLTTSNPTGVLFEIGGNPLATDGGVSVRFVAGVLTASVANATTHLLNTRIKTISDLNTHILSLRINTAAVAPADQVVMLVDGSSSGVTAPISTDLASVVLSSTKPNVGARNNAASNFLPFSMNDEIFLQTSRLSDSDNLAVYDYMVYIQGLYI